MTTKIIELDRANVPQTTLENTEPGKENNDLRKTAGGKAINTDKRESVFLKRRKNRPRKLRSLAGTARESGNVYIAFVNGEITAGEAEIRSRMLRRHAETLTALEQQEYMALIEQKLQQIAERQTGRLMATFSPAEFAADKVTQ